MARSLIGFIIGVLLVYPGAEVFRWLASEVLGIYADMTLTDACLAMIIIMQAILLVRGSRPGTAARYPPAMRMVGHRAELEPTSLPTRRKRPRRRPLAEASDLTPMRVHMPEDDLERRRTRSSRRSPRL